MDNELIIETSGLTKIYHGKKVVNNVSLNVPKNKIYGFLGPNGAGKSTTMKMLLGLSEPTSGEISIFGETMNSKNRISILKDTGSLIESPSYYGNLTGYENLKISCILKNLPFSEISRVLSIVRMEAHKNKNASHYSLGMKQRLGIANALLGNPRLLLLDEPTNGLDPAGIHEMRSLIRSLPDEYGVTIMISSHLLSEMEQLSDNIGIIASGKMLFQNTLKSLQSMGEKNILISTSNNPKAKLLINESFSIKAQINEENKDFLTLPFLDNAITSKIAKRIMEENIGIYRISEKTKNLEEIYLSMVKEGGL